MIVPILLPCLRTLFLLYAYSVSLAGGVFHRGFPLLSQSLAAAIRHTTSKDYSSNEDVQTMSMDSMIDSMTPPPQAAHPHPRQPERRLRGARAWERDGMAGGKLRGLHGGSNSARRTRAL